ncbi:MAG: adenylate kinase [Clostridia bacterium]|nr:adenylate kinase [Clostridia bacterium]
MNLILMGAPGAGKGTQSERISAKWGIPVIATGDILRAAIKAETELGKRARSYIDAGQLVPDEIVIGIIKESITSDACKNGFILDGFPRSIPQAIALEEMGIRVDAVLFIDVEDEKIVQRMSGRRVCTCGASYHVDYKPSQKEGVCDKCGAALFVRKDDAPETVLKRLMTYHEQTEPVKAYYAQRGLLVTVQGQEGVDDTTRLTLEALSRFLKR